MTTEGMASESVTVSTLEPIVMQLVLDYRGDLEDFERLEFERQTVRGLNSYPAKYLPVLKANLEQLDPAVATVIASKVATGHTDEVDLEEYAYFLPLIQTEDKFLAEAIMLSLRDYMHAEFIAPAWDYSKTNEQLRTQSLALMNVAAAIQESCNRDLESEGSVSSRTRKLLVRITDETLIRELVADPDSAASVCKVIRKYKVSGYLSIRGILDGINPALSGGTL